MVYVYKPRSKIYKNWLGVGGCGEVSSQRTLNMNREKNIPKKFHWNERWACSNECGNSGDGASQVDRSARDKVAIGSAGVGLGSDWAS
jgi:hypothetical protein